MRTRVPGATFHDDQMKETMNSSVNAVRSNPHPKFEARLYGFKFLDDLMNETMSNSVNALHHGLPYITAC